ncbi:hypothetical protein C5167_045567 [Papaver somniferum]|uniref:RNA-binding protein NOB1 n=1 Tax=Papaver somniferum TaxID=3469 RepID=A0A4Y7LDS9_PAPSO|nr:RNA-binding protein NOB1-like [Papaver somniferum]XP_026426829.1 RNA-binding protein NOB1-like [Papaver somniferum]RZC82780.1 hypothetical protein C5167_045567 [Papaver somniferum]
MDEMTPSAQPPPTTTALPTSCWSKIVQKEAPPKPKPANYPTNRVFEGSCKSSKGISVAVVDANAIIQGGINLNNVADKFVSVSEVLEEIKDPVSRQKLELLPFTVETMEPSAESLNKVISFARATGDLQVLSDVDLKLVALTYMLESQIHGTNHLRDTPPPIHVVNVKRLAEKDMPGWGSNVPNLDEWEALEHAVDQGSNSESRILPLKDLNLNLLPVDGNGDSQNGLTEDVSETRSETHSEDVGRSYRKPRRYAPVKKEINTEGKMVADGVDASQGQDDNSIDWLPAVCRSTHRRFLRRKARRELSEALSESNVHPDGEESTDGDIEDTQGPNQKLDGTRERLEVVNNNIEDEEKTVGEKNDDGDLTVILEQMRLEPGLSGSVLGATCNEEYDQLDISSETNDSVDTSFVDDGSSEQSWALRSLSESSVACVTGDFAMQNVILQIGLRLLAPGGMQIRELHRWILKCHACNKVTTEIGRIFCPKCGNGGTLRKVAATVGENGVVLASRKPRITLRGTKFSLPLPQGGRDAITKNLILREDQLPHKVLYPKTKKKSNMLGDDIFISDDIFRNSSDKRAPLQPPVRKALAVFSGKRNPNDNHYSRAKH